MLAAIDIHKAVFQTAVLNPDNGEIVQHRFAASREALVGWIEERAGSLSVVAIQATTGWRWVARELQARGIEVRLCDPGQASALQGNRKRPKTDRLDARWLVLLLAPEPLPHPRVAWPCCCPAGFCRPRGGPPPTFRACATRRACARRSPTITRAGRNACTH